MLKVRERAGQLRLFCQPLDDPFWRWEWPGGPLEYDDEAFNAAFDSHEFEAVCSDGDGVAFACRLCGDYRWVYRW